ncbi:MBL fold metallo-hydrolase [Treponema zuelzerae]|uniref:MBL fold metallo-hydrolase n=1 Tax=Teretinema zuelzerae TaxID=156 RepID=A0AAE3EKK3_9SPIR|nr:MBL fold metallo-hydrolase [Teretinema zuelzerae]MCD1656167.1 MBL fold metallo-hydrolase [Teretinema zuelzerae]
MSIYFYSLGAAEEVTGSKHIIEVDGRMILVDCGAFQGRRAEADEKNRNFEVPADKMDAVVLTHAHYDHCGLLPLLGLKGFNGNIYATPATRDLANIIMMDSARIQARDAEYLQKQARKHGQEFSWRPLYNEQDAINTTNQIITISYRRPTWITPNILLEFFDAGHILGSAMALITVTDGEGNTKKIACTGDLGRKGKAIIRDPEILPPADYIVLESTYGDRLHETTEDALAKLADVATKAIKMNGKIVIPAFAIERTQELVYYFHVLVDRKIIPEIPIFVDSPMAVNATSIFQVHPECYDEATHEAFIKHHKNPFGFNSLRFVTSVEESKSLNEMEGPMIIISADGMCEAGRITHHLANTIGDPCNQILIVGYMAEHTLGRRILNREMEVRIFNQWYNVRAEITQINAFSAHADYQEATDWLQSMDTSGLKRIFMVHGEPEVQVVFKDHLEENGFKSVQIVKYGEHYEL